MHHWHIWVLVPLEFHVNLVLQCQVSLTPTSLLIIAYIMVNETSIKLLALVVFTWVKIWVLNRGRGNDCGRVTILHTVENCGQIWPISSQLRLLAISVT
jgi:hypothetical protein